jgi:glycosyltransferase involved in cell wall biosynthesis
MSLGILDGRQAPPEFQVCNLYEPAHSDRADRVRLALERLLREQRFDLIEFGVGGGLGFRTMQAKRAGLAFQDVTLAVRLDTCGAWSRQHEERWLADLEEVEVDFAERYSFQHADIRVAPSLELLAFVLRSGWTPVVPSRHERSTSNEYPLVTIGIAYYNLGKYLPETLAALVNQTYRNFEVLVIDDGSIDSHSIRVFAEMETRYPQYRFLRQPNLGIGATRNRCLELARGEYFIPVDADNVSLPQMVERFVAAIRRNPDLDAMTCYFLAFEDGSRKILHAGRPTGGPHVLASIRNIYGDANAIFRTQSFREIGGYETDRGTSCEDWEAFVKLVNAGKRIGVVPDHLFYYRQLADGFSRRTNKFANHERVLRQFKQLPIWPQAEGTLLWSALLGFHQSIERLKSRQSLWRYRIADAVVAVLRRVPWAIRGLKWILCRCQSLWRANQPLAQGAKQSPITLTAEALAGARP